MIKFEDEVLKDDNLDNNHGAEVIEVYPVESQLVAYLDYGVDKVANKFKVRQVPWY